MNAARLLFPVALLATSPAVAATPGDELAYEAPHDCPSAPSWDRVEEELPDFLPALRDAIAMDNRTRRMG